jgi:hypothetical protein
MKERAMTPGDARWMTIRPRLARTPESPEGFDHVVFSDEDDEAGYRLGGHTFREGDHVSIREHGGEMHPFRTARVESA